MRAYIARYPDGLFSEVARDRLAAIEAERLAEAQADERALWEEGARPLDTIDAYDRYPRQLPPWSFRRRGGGAYRGAADRVDAEELARPRRGRRR